MNKKQSELQSIHKEYMKIRRSILSSKKNLISKGYRMPQIEGLSDIKAGNLPDKIGKRELNKIKKIQQEYKYNMQHSADEWSLARQKRYKKLEKQVKKDIREAKTSLKDYEKKINELNKVPVPSFNASPAEMQKFVDVRKELQKLQSEAMNLRGKIDKMGITSDVKMKMLGVDAEYVPSVVDNAVYQLRDYIWETMAEIAHSEKQEDYIQQAMENAHILLDLLDDMGINDEDRAEAMAEAIKYTYEKVYEVTKDFIWFPSDEFDKQPDMDKLSEFKHLFEGVDNLYAKLRKEKDQQSEQEESDDENDSKTTTKVKIGRGRMVIKTKIKADK